MTPEKMFISLRKDILSNIGEIRNSWGYFYDVTTPNSSIRRDLQNLFEKYLSEFKQYGFHIVHKHYDCGSPHHDNEENEEHGFRYNDEDSEILRLEGVSYQHIDQFDQKKEQCICPCSAQNSITNHTVIKEIYIENDANRKTCEAIQKILGNLNYAISKTGDKQPRSAIRENLLLAILNINDFLLPKPIDEYISELEKS